MRVLVWHWGRFGAGPRMALCYAETFRALPQTDSVLSLPAAAELLGGDDAPACELPVHTYSGLAGFGLRLLGGPAMVPGLAARIRALRPDFALCAMPAPLDLVMAASLRRAGVPFAAVIHDADLHPGDGYPLQMLLQRQLMRRAGALVALSDHVAARLRQQGFARGRPLLTSRLPPLEFRAGLVSPRAHGGRLRLLAFGRLLPYKGLDLLAEAYRRLGGRPDVELRVVGQGPESEALRMLRALPNVRVENRWVPESEVPQLLDWSDALVLSHREASQSGVAAAAIGAGRWVVSTRVGGLEEQLRNEAMAILCDPEPGSIATALRRLLDDPPALQDASRSGRGWQADAASLLLGLRDALMAGASRLEVPA